MKMHGYAREGFEMSGQRSIEALIEELDATQDDEARAPILLELLRQPGHERHEDIVFELGLIGLPDAVEAIATSAASPFPYIEEWGNLHEFQRKCAYALARIGTERSREALEQMAGNLDHNLREYGAEGLEHWPLPWKNR
jgi:HEAT repeat protein